MPRGPQDMRLRWPQDPPQEPVEPTRWNPPSAKCIDGQNDVPAYAKRLSSPLPFTHLSLLHSQLFILPQLDRIECIYVYIYFIYTLERWNVRMRVSMHVSGWYVGARLFQRHVHERRGVHRCTHKETSTQRRFRYTHTGAEAWTGACIRLVGLIGRTSQVRAGITSRCAAVEDRARQSGDRTGQDAPIASDGFERVKALS